MFDLGTDSTEVKKTKTQERKEKLSALLEAEDQKHLNKTSADHTDSSVYDNSFKELYEQSLQNHDLKAGDVVKGHVISVEEDYVLVDVNYKSEGRIPKSEFRMVAGQENIQVGQELDVYIDHVENDQGMMVLSKDRADIMKIWKDISKVVENEEVIEGTVIAKVKGGLSVDIGVNAFLPGSQIDFRPVRDLNSYIGNKYQFKVIKFNQKRGNIVLSRRVLLNQERKNLLTRTLSEVKEGAVIKGVVKNITDYGVFLDLGGMDGLLHITDMSWNRVKHPSELVSLGSEIEVKVLKFDEEKNRISLGLKQLTENPWNKVGAEIKVGDIIKAQVVSLTEYGAFMKLIEGVEGLVHLNEMSWGKKIKHPSDILKVGDTTDVKVLDVDEENHRISLGIKQLKKNPWSDLKAKYPVNMELETKIKYITDFGVFVEIPGEDVDGFIHSSDLSWTEHIKPKSVYKEGDTVKARVKGINSEEEHFNLSVKNLDNDPWVNVESHYPPGSHHEVKVIKLMDFGVFVELEPGVEGLIHISELSTKRIDNPQSVVKLGDKLKAEVLSIDLDARKISLSVKFRESSKTHSTSSTKLHQEKSSGKSTEQKKQTESFFGRALKASLGGLMPAADTNKQKDEQTDKQEHSVDKNIAKSPNSNNEKSEEE